MQDAWESASVMVAAIAANEQERHSSATGRTTTTTWEGGRQEVPANERCEDGWGGILRRTGRESIEIDGGGDCGKNGVQLPPLLRSLHGRTLLYGIFLLLLFFFRINMQLSLFLFPKSV
ncbi:hypothetical protein R1flu_022299 [Riccia fluitans]|uniref:Uncharacterized protein n=1 Tax=Riccia fluitans TaxID=41844 RepID=A0ABD1ZT37_9MARC